MYVVTDLISILHIIFYIYDTLHTHNTYDITGKREWVGDNAWKELPVMKVALGVKSNEVVAWVIDRMTR